MTRLRGDRGRRLAALCERYGWRMAGVTSKGHVKLVKPGCRPLITAGTPSDRRGIANLAADMRRLGRKGM